MVDEDEISVIEDSDNVFADLAVAKLEEELAKARLAGPHTANHRAP
ncbi:MAG: hypothetical protein ABI306_09995 [Caulobacteraceae bacterium]